MKIGITMSVIMKQFSLKEGIETLAELGFDSIDFPLNVYTSVRDHGNSIYNVMYTDKWRNFAKDVRSMLDENGVEAYQTHALWGLYTDMSEYIPPEEQYFRQIMAASLIGSRELVFHPIPPTIKINSIAERDRVVDYNIRWFRELVPCAEEYGINLCLENTFTHEKNLPGDGLFPFVDGETMNMLAEGIGSKNVSFCLDTGHANVEHGPDMVKLAHDIAPRLKALHVHDNFGVLEPLLNSDLHMFPGYGSSDLEALCVELGKNAFDGVMSLEPSHRNMPRERLLLILRAAVDIARYYANIVEKNRLTHKD